MNTLEPSQITNEVEKDTDRLFTREQIDKIKKIWKLTTFHSAREHLLYAFIRGSSVDKAFPPTITQRRIKRNESQGKSPRHGLQIAINNVATSLENIIWVYKKAIETGPEKYTLIIMRNEGIIISQAMAEEFLERLRAVDTTPIIKYYEKITKPAFIRKDLLIQPLGNNPYK